MSHSLHASLKSDVNRLRKRKGRAIDGRRAAVMLARLSSSISSKEGTDSHVAHATRPMTVRMEAEMRDSANRRAPLLIPTSCSRAASIRLRHAPSAPDTQLRMRPRLGAMGDEVGSCGRAYGDVEGREEIDGSSNEERGGDE